MDPASLLPFLLIVAVGYLLLVRPARTRQRHTAQMLEQLRPGVQVMTTAGLYATVVSLGDDRVTLEVSPGVLCHYDKRAVARVLQDDGPAAEETVDTRDGADGTRGDGGLDPR